MQFLIDAQLPPALSNFFKDRGHETFHVVEVLSADSDDSEIWRWAIENSFIVVTKDEDFSLRVERAKLAPQILWIRTGNISNKTLVQLLVSIWPKVTEQLLSGQRVVEVF